MSDNPGAKRPLPPIPEKKPLHTKPLPKPPKPPKPPKRLPRVPQPLPKPPKEVTAKEFDTLCTIAIKHGFKDCTEVRTQSENEPYLKTTLKAGDKVIVPSITPKEERKATEKQYKFVREGLPLTTIRFVHGSKTLPYKEDVESTHLFTSNYRPHKAGKNRKKKFVNDNHRKFHTHADADEDTFKVEVTDHRTEKKEIEVELDALKPVYKDDGGIEKWEPFDGDRKQADTEAGKRMLDTKLSKQGTIFTKKKSKCFRTCYLRLVVDTHDQGKDDTDGREKQTLLVTDMSEAADAEGNEEKAKAMRKVEILDQKVRASYLTDGCPAPDPQMKCQIRKELPVGKNKKRVKVAINVLRDGRDGTPCVDIKKAENWARKYVRWLYAQANMSIEFVEDTRAVQPPTNVIVVGWPNGPKAKGGGTIKVGVTVDGEAEVDCEITTTADDTPKQTASKLRRKIITKIGGLTVRAYENPKNSKALDKQTAVVIVGDSQTQNIELILKETSDRDQIMGIVRIVGTEIEETGTPLRRPHSDHEWGAVGTKHFLALYYNYDSGRDRIDVFFVGGMDMNSYGEAMRPKREQAKAAWKPNAKGVNTVFVRKKPITGDIVHRTLAHEMGHVLMDVGHVTGEDTEMMSGGSAGGNEKIVNGQKRISRTKENAYHLEFTSGYKKKGNPTHFLRTHNGECVKGW